MPQHLVFEEIRIGGEMQKDAIGLMYDKPNDYEVTAVIILPHGKREIYPIGKRFTVTARCDNGRVMRDIPGIVTRNAAVERGIAIFVRLARKDPPLVGRRFG